MNRLVLIRKEQAVEIGNYQYLIFSIGIAGIPNN